MSISAEWLAGFFDGEGCVTILKDNRGCGHFTPTVVFTNTHKETLDTIRAQYGGTIHAKRSKNKGWSVGWTLNFSGAQSAMRLLKIIQPYLITKRAEVDFFMSEWSTKVKDERYRLGSRLVSQEQTAIREAIKAQLSAMKSRNAGKTLN